MFRRKQKSEKTESKAPRMRDEKSTLASILLSMKAVTPEQLEAAKKAKEDHETSHADMLLASTLRSMGFCSSDDVSVALKIQSKMLDGDRASVALDLMEARIDRYRAGEEQLHREIEKRRAREKSEAREEKTPIVIPFSPVTAKAF
jgi:hypothetical protein